jgi:rubredoxin
MIRIEKKPKREYKSIKEYALYYCSYRDNVIKNDKYPCILCKGFAWIYDPREKPDPVEGHKLTRRITCPECNGSKNTSKKNFIEKAWRPMIERHKSLVGDWKKNMDMIKSIKKKLTPKEIKFMELYYHQKETF